MSDENPLLALVLASNSFLGAAEAVEHEVMPLDTQRDLKPGDAAVVAHAATPLERDLTIVKLLDAEKYSQNFPDWEERVTLKSYVLCEAFSADDPEPHLGWFSRVKLLPITRYRYTQARFWTKVGFPEEFPDWVLAAHDGYNDAIAEQAPTRVARAASCEECGKRKVFLEVWRYVKYSGRVGHRTIDGEEKLVPIQDADVEEHYTPTLTCRDCGYSRKLTDDEWTMPGITTP